jgi:hypothetical protein
MKTIFREFDRAERAEAFYNLAESKGGRGFDIKYAAAGENNHGTETFILLVMEVPENETISLCEHRDENNYHANCLNEGVTEALNPHGGKVWKCAEHALEPTEPEAEAAPVKPPFVAQPMRPRAESETTEAAEPTPADDLEDAKQDYSTAIQAVQKSASEAARQGDEMLLWWITGQLNRIVLPANQVLCEGEDVPAELAVSRGL